MDVRFVILSPASRKGSHAIRLPVLVGRSDEAKFRVQQDSVSRKHCEFFATDDAVFVRDLESTNGTFLGGERIASAVATAVPPGAELRIGGIVFRVEYEPPAAVPPPAQGDDTVPLAAFSDPDAEVEASAAAEPDEAPELPAVADGEEEPVESTGFNFLAPADEPPAAEGDDQLDDFFKSLK